MGISIKKGEIDYELVSRLNFILLEKFNLSRAEKLASRIKS